MNQHWSNGWYGGMMRWLKKSSMETMSHARICIWFWDDWKFEPFIFLLFLARNIDHVSFDRSGSLFLAQKTRKIRKKSKRNWIRGKNDSNFEPSQFFRAKKSEPLRPKDTWSIFRERNKRKMNGSNFEPSQNQMHMLACDIVSIDDFLSHLTIPRTIF